MDIGIIKRIPARFCAALYIREHIVTDMDIRMLLSQLLFYQLLQASGSFTDTIITGYKNPVQPVVSACSKQLPHIVMRDIHI